MLGFTVYDQLLGALVDISANQIKSNHISSKQEKQQMREMDEIKAYDGPKQQQFEITTWPILCQQQQQYFR